MTLFGFHAGATVASLSCDGKDETASFQVLGYSIASGDDTAGSEKFQIGASSGVITTTATAFASKQELRENNDPPQIVEVRTLPRTHTHYCVIHKECLNSHPSSVKHKT